ncbi:hypothetical protein [Leucobacter ruminantium]|uniref:Uncharacterized protein n=1 Tax=Leucobacter ruminantium TaxID=1289170 RepID=A0A939LYR5_9MICO|nr:hypothetical protein [Leucobacter ruminantium]MBO1806596.1 hypothetical protein [Leucobacter ruminantium]
MSETENTARKGPDHRRVARKRAERWERAVQDSGHAYAPTEETALHREAEINREQDDDQTGCYLAGVT